MMKKLTHVFLLFSMLGSANVMAVDTDGDGLEDAWEQSYFGDLAADGNGDPDGDLLTNTEEQIWLADPTLWDTDGDGLSDGYEVNTFGSNPLNSDSDGDSLGDEAESIWGTNPNNIDTDADGFSDHDEVVNGTSPTVLDEDTDGDGIANALDSDDDNDAMPDEWELANGRNPILADYAFAISETHSCGIDDVGVKCSGGPAVPAAFADKTLEPYAISVGDMWTCACHTVGGPYTCWGSGTPTTPTCSTSLSDTKSGNYDIDDSCTDVDKTLTCSSDNGANVWCDVYASKTFFHECENGNSGSGFAYPYPVGKVAVVTVSFHSVCSLTDRGVRCSYGVGPTPYGNLTGGYRNVEWLFIDPDMDGIDSLLDTEPLVFNDEDSDGVGDGFDWDDDNDGVPDTVDAEPLNNTNPNEITLPLDGSYKGLQYKQTK